MMYKDALALDWLVKDQDDEISPAKIGLLSSLGALGAATYGGRKVYKNLKETVNGLESLRGLKDAPTRVGWLGRRGGSANQFEHQDLPPDAYGPRQGVYWTPVFAAEKLREANEKLKGIPKTGPDLKPNPAYEEAAAKLEALRERFNAVSFNPFFEKRRALVRNHGTMIRILKRLGFIGK